MVLAKAYEKALGSVDAPDLIRALEGLEIALPEDPPGFVSWIDPLTHQIQQTQAIGTPVLNNDYPPAKVMLGNWVVYSAQELQQNSATIKRRMSAESPDSKKSRPESP
ncbi:hypothetical protein D3C78_1683780 [compost metagenome]